MLTSQLCLPYLVNHSLPQQVASLFILVILFILLLKIPSQGVLQLSVFVCMYTDYII